MKTAPWSQETRNQHCEQGSHKSCYGKSAGYDHLEFLRGKWLDNGENYIFSEDKTGAEHMVSGQHRAAGLVMAQAMYDKDPESWPDAQLEVPTLFTRGVCHETADSVDTGKVRNHADVRFRSPLVDEYIPDEWNSSEARRKKWCKALATAARVVWQRQDGKTVSSAEKFVTSEMLQFIGEEHPDLPWFVTLVMNADDGDGGHGGLKKVSIAYMIALCYIACLDAEGTPVESSIEKVEVFLDHLAQGTGYESGDAAHALAGFWNGLEPGSKDRDLDISGPIVKALNALLEGESITARQVKLTKKERTQYREFPPLLAGWDEAAFEYAAEVRAAEAEVEEEEDEVEEDVVEEETEEAIAA